MGRVKVLVCGVADLTREMVMDLSVTVVPYYVSFGGTTYREDLEFDRTLYNDHMAGMEELPTTSHPNTEDIRGMLTDARKDHDDVLYLTAPRKLTKTHDLARKVVEDLGDDRIRVVDTGTAVGSLALVTVAAARAAKEGMTLDEVERAAFNVADRIGLYMVLETLKNLLKGGRIGRAQAFLGQMLSVKPIVTLEDGVATPAGKALTTPHALDWILRRIYDDMERLNGDRIRAVVEHAGNPEWAVQVREQLKQRFEIEELFETTMTALVATHAGPGVWGVSYHVL
jgi:DegV family protein with EDD domain